MLLRRALAYPLFGNPETYWYARLTTYLALQHSRRPKQAARQRLLTARDLAQKQDARALIGKVDRALARLG